MTTPPKTLLLFLGCAALLAGSYLTLQNLKETMEAQVTDRLTQAVGHISNESLDVRLGGIYALERIAAGSERDYEPILHILITYVRERAPWKEDGSARQGQLAKPAPDVQAALTVIGRRKHAYKQGETQRLDLRKTDLRGANLSGAHLEGAILSGVHLEGAILHGTNLKEAILREAHLENASLVGARLEKAYLGGARLDGAILRDAHLEDAYASEARLDGADLLGADLTGAFGLTWEQIKTARKDNRTRLPNDLKAQRPSPGSP